MGIRIVTLTVALYLPLGGWAQQDESAPPQESTAPPEEIVVTGDSSMVQLRTQMMAAEV